MIRVSVPVVSLFPAEWTTKYLNPLLDSYLSRWERKRIKREVRFFLIFPFERFYRIDHQKLVPLIYVEIHKTKEHGPRSDSPSGEGNGLKVEVRAGTCEPRVDRRGTLFREGMGLRVKFDMGSVTERRIRDNHTTTLPPTQKGLELQRKGQPLRGIESKWLNQLVGYN